MAFLLARFLVLSTGLRPLAHSSFGRIQLNAATISSTGTAFRGPMQVFAAKAKVLNPVFIHKCLTGVG